jgi:dipeptidase E
MAATRRLRSLSAQLRASRTAAAGACTLAGSQQSSFPKRKIFACGAGPSADADWLRDQIIAATGKQKPKVVWMGTPSYDGRQGAIGFADAGLEVEWLNVTDLEALPPPESIAATLRSADIIQVSGGNTLFAVRRWRNLGVDKLLHEAMVRGCVLCGGSAGCICWFDGGHSDSLAPSTVHPDFRKELTEQERLDWSYCRVKGLGFIDAFCCPHHNQHERHSTVSRSEHFDSLLRLSPGEVGIGVDNDACFVVEGDSWRGALHAWPAAVPQRTAICASCRASLLVCFLCSGEQRLRQRRWESLQKGVRQWRDCG